MDNIFTLFYGNVPTADYDAYCGVLHVPRMTLNCHFSEAMCRFAQLKLSFQISILALFDLVFHLLHTSI